MYLCSGSTGIARTAREGLTEEGKGAAPLACRASEYCGGCSDGSSGDASWEGSSLRRSGIQGLWSPSSPALDGFDAISAVCRNPSRKGHTNPSEQDVLSHSVVTRSVMSQQQHRLRFECNLSPQILKRRNVRHLPGVCSTYGCHLLSFGLRCSQAERSTMPIASLSQHSHSQAPLNRFTRLD